MIDLNRYDWDSPPMPDPENDDGPAAILGAFLTLGILSAVGLTSYALWQMVRLTLLSN